jgi:hypothetical protein
MTTGALHYTPLSLCSQTARRDKVILVARKQQGQMARNETVDAK